MGKSVNKICRSCGKKRQKRSKICPHCGGRMEQDTEVISNYLDQKTEKKKPKGG